MQTYVCPHSTFTCNAETLRELATTLHNPRVANAPVNNSFRNFNFNHGAITFSTDFSDDYRQIKYKISSENYSPGMAKQFNIFNKKVQAELEKMRAEISAKKAAKFPSNLSKKQRRNAPQSLPDDEDDADYENYSFSHKRNKNLFFNKNYAPDFSMPDFISGYTSQFTFKMVATTRESVAYALGLEAIKKKAMFLFICNRIKTKNKRFIFVIYLLFFSKIRLPLRLLKECRQFLPDATPETGLNYLQHHGSLYLIAPPYNNLNDISLSGFLSAKKNNIKNPDFLPINIGKIELKKFDLGGYDSEYSDFLSPDRNSTFQTENKEEDYDIIISSEDEGDKIKLKIKNILKNKKNNVENENDEDSKNNDEDNEEIEEYEDNEERNDKEKDPDYENEEEESDDSDDNEEIPKRIYHKIENNKKSATQKDKRKKIDCDDGNGYGYGLANDLEKLNRNFLKNSKKNDIFFSKNMQDIAKKYFNNNDNQLGGLINNDDNEQKDDNLNYQNNNQATSPINFDIQTNFNNINKKNEGTGRTANSPIKTTTCASELSKFPNSNLFENSGATKKTFNNKNSTLWERENPISDDSDDAEIKINKINSKGKYASKSPSTTRKGYKNHK